MITKAQVDQAKQNKIHYIVDDLITDLDVLSGDESHTTEEIKTMFAETLLRRGVFKWFAARRKMIREKDALKAQTKVILDAITGIKTRLTFMHAGKHEHIVDYDNKVHSLSFYQQRLAFLRGQLLILNQVRKSLREIAHGSRIDAADNDRGAQEFVNQVLFHERYWGEGLPDILDDVKDYPEDLIKQYTQGEWPVLTGGEGEVCEVCGEAHGSRHSDGQDELNEYLEQELRDRTDGFKRGC